MKKQKPVVVIGSGGREHTLAYKLAESEKVSTVFVVPGNGGTMAGKIHNLTTVDISDHAKFVKFCSEKDVALVCIGPEIPLVEGIVDSLASAGIPAFGPTKSAARLEGSKAFSKAFMVRNGIPTAEHRSFTEYEAARVYVEQVTKTSKVVVKASGLAAGKGVILPETTTEALIALREILIDLKFGKEAGKEVVVEEFMEGPELSVFAFSDGSNIHLLPASQDHKRALNGDRGLNTGGMGAYCPAPIFTSNLKSMVEKDIVQRSIDAAKKEGFPFCGLLYVGLMITANGPKVLEYNCRFGDPETEAVLMLLESDLFEIMAACSNGNLPSVQPILCDDSKSAVTIVAASEGYPESYPKGRKITGIEDAETISGIKVFHAGTKKVDGQLVTSGGRVLAVSSIGSSLREALDLAYSGMRKIHFDGMHYRTDIGYRALKRNTLVEFFENQYKKKLILVSAAFVALGAFLISKRKI